MKLIKRIWQRSTMIARSSFKLRRRNNRLCFEPLESRRVFAWWDSLSAEFGGTETASATRYLAADFTTDSAATALTAVLMLSKSSDAIAQVDLYSDATSGLEPGSKLGTFTQSGTISSSLSEVAFTLQGVSLQANVDYWIVVRPTAGTIDWAWTSDFTVQNDWSNSEDSGATWFTSDVYPPQYSVAAGVANTLPQVTIADSIVDEGSGLAQFVVSLSAATSQAVVIEYQTLDGTAQSGTDYQAKTSRLTIPAGSTTGTIEVTLIDDTVDEDNETFTVQLTSVTNASLSETVATGTIVNDDSPHMWQYQRNHLDVNADGFVTALDALLIINRINDLGAGALPLSGNEVPPPYFDCSGDDYATPLDALLVINELNQNAVGEFWQDVRK